MNCSLRYSILPNAPEFAKSELLNAVMEEVGGIAPTCPDYAGSYEIPSEETCQDAPSFGRMFYFKQLTCADWIDESIKSSASKGQHVTAGELCSWAGSLTLTALKEVYSSAHVPYTPPSGYNPDTTLVLNLCNSTCGAVGFGPCWLRGAVQPWCEPVSDTAQAQSIMI